MSKAGLILSQSPQEFVWAFPCSLEIPCWALDIQDIRRITIFPKQSAQKRDVISDRCIGPY